MGRLLCLASAAAFGALGIFGKLAYAAGVGRQELLMVRFVLAAVILAGLHAAVPSLRRPDAGAPPLTARVRRQTYLIAFLLGAVGYAVQASFYFAALERIDASMVAILLYTFPAMVTVGSVLLGRDRLTWTKGLALAVASAGVLLVVPFDATTGLDTLGVLLAIGGALTYTVYILVSDGVVDRLPAVQFSSIIMAGAGVSMTVVTFVQGGPRLDFAPIGWLWLLGIALVCTVFAVVAFFAGLRLTTPATTSILSTFEPVVAAFLAVVLLHEQVTWRFLVGGGLVLLAAVVVHRSPAAVPE